MTSKQVTSPPWNSRRGAQAKKWFGHCAGRSPCAHSIGKFFLCYIVLFLLETSAPGLSGHYWYRNLGRIRKQIYDWVVVETCFIFTPLWGNDPNWLRIFSNRLKPPHKKYITPEKWQLLHLKTHLPFWNTSSNPAHLLHLWNGRWYLQNSNNL